MLSLQKGYVLLVVNVASYCKSVNQYPDLNDLDARFRKDGLRILAVPCNQFGMQEPNSNATQFLDTLKHVRVYPGFEPTFEHTWKTPINGRTAHPLFKLLRTSCPSPKKTFAKQRLLFYEPFHNNDIRWNNEKFLIDHKGRIRRRYASEFKPSGRRLQHDIKYLLTKRNHH